MRKRDRAMVAAAKLLRGGSTKRCQLHVRVGLSRCARLHKAWANQRTPSDTKAHNCSMHSRAHPQLPEKVSLVG